MKEQDYDQLARRAKKMHLTARSLIRSMQAGSFQSMYYGHGVEFSGVREYLIDDDIRAIDWNVTARMGKPFVKLFSEDRELQVFMIVDRSRSMNTGSSSKTRLACAVETGELLTLVAEQSSSPVGAVFFSNEIEAAYAPKRGQKQIQLLLSQFNNEDNNTKPGSVLANALTGTSKLLKKHSLIFILSDFRIGGWSEPLSYLSMKHDIVAVRITDSLDRELPDTGSIPFVDNETGIRRIFPTSSGVFRRMWRDADRKRVEQWKEICARCHCIPLELSTADDPAVILSRFFASRDKR